MQRVIVSILTFLLLATGGGAATAQQSPLPVYRVTPLSNPDLYSPSIADMNNAGQVTGEFIGASGLTEAYVSVGRELRGLGLLNGYSTSARSVNNAGDVAGTAVEPTEYRRRRAFLYADGQMRDLGDLGGDWATAAAVNGARQVVGLSGNAFGEPRAFLYAHGHMTDLSAMAPEGRQVNPVDINERGDITGTWVIDGEPRSFVYAAGQWTDLGSLGGINAWPNRINDAGWVTGSANRVDIRLVAFLYTPEGGMRELAFENDAFQVIGRGLNNRGEVVGDGYSDHGPCCTFFSRGAVTTELNALLEPGSGWTIYQAFAINDRGEIAGYGCGEPGCTIVRLAPVPEPAAWAILLAGLGLLWWRRRPRPARAPWAAGGAGLLACILMAGGPAQAAAPLAYTVTPYPPGEADARATDVNNQAHLLGIFTKSGGPWVDQGVQSPFLSTGPGFIDLGNVMTSFRPAGMNDLDQVAGTATVGTQARRRAYLYRDGAVSSLGTLGGHNSGANAINNAGQVVGYSTLPDGPEHAFFYQDGIMRDIGTLGASSRAADINERGQVVGDYADSAGRTHAFLYDNGSMRDIGNLGGDYAVATDIGNGGHVLGIATGADGVDHNFIYYNGIMTALPGGAQPIRAFGINLMGDAVGSRTGVADRGAFLWSDGLLHNIAELIDPATGYTVFDAIAINDLGQIAATGCLRGSCSAVLLSPIPEPSGLVLLLAGLGLTAALHRRRPRHAVRRRHPLSISTTSSSARPKPMMRIQASQAMAPVPNQSWAGVQ